MIYQDSAKQMYSKEDYFVNQYIISSKIQKKIICKKLKLTFMIIAKLYAILNHIGKLSKLAITEDIE